MTAADTETVLTSDQERAVEMAVRSVKRGSRLFKIGGYAGTGKTTIARTIVDMLPDAAVCAFTGKAASVLRRKGLEAQTIHSTIYRYDEFRRAFIRKPHIEAQYFLIDEGSMVARNLWDDLQTFGKSILVIGDPGQLEPVGDDPNLMREPDVVLSEIHRQASGSAIIQFAHHVRNGGSFRSGEKGDVLIADESCFWNSIGWADQLLCGFNKTRVDANKAVRSERGFTKTIEEGERLIVLQNDMNLGVFNGMMLRVTRVGHVTTDRAVIDAESEDGTEYRSLTVWRLALNNQGWQKGLDRRRLIGGAVVDYGYCTTVHKFQGSEADKVAVLDEQCDLWNPVRWRYTAITRAADKLRYCMTS